MTIKKELLDELLRDYKNPGDMFGESGILSQFKKAIIERAMQGEMAHHLGYDKYAPEGKNSGNSRNGSFKKTIKDETSELTVAVPRDRQGSFEPKIIPKGQTRFNGFDDKIISMYARGMSVREIQGHLEEIYGVEVSPDLISTVTNEVIDEVHTWQDRPLDAVYPIVFLDALRVKIRHEGTVKNKAIYLAIGINMDGLKEVLGLWIAETEGAKFWLQVVTEMRNRGIEDILIACVDGLKGFPEAIESVFPRTSVQLCIVHLVRNSLKYVPYKDRRKLACDLKEIYQSVSRKSAEESLKEFKTKWDGKYSMISKSWADNWDRVIFFLDFPPEIRRAIYTTNAIESLNMTLRKVIKNRASFPNDESATKLIYLALRNIEKKWTMPIKDWGSAINQFSIKFEGRVPMN